MKDPVALAQLAAELGIQIIPGGSTPQLPPRDPPVPKPRGWDQDDGSPWAAIEMSTDTNPAGIYAALAIDPRSEEGRERIGWHDGWLFVDGVTQEELDIAAEVADPGPVEPDPVARDLQRLWVHDRLDVAAIREQVKAEVLAEVRAELGLD